MTSAKNKKEQISFRLSETLKDRIDVAVDKTQRSQSNFIEVALDYYIDILERNNYADPKRIKNVSEPESIYATHATKEEVRAVNEEIARLKVVVENLIKKVEEK
ncbi:MAG: ribbon-helix-helix protein, CopG family [Novosphingobium sp.]|nr:ribbon-helix-helix protein, CopG family [Novosphingobium sp.]